VAAAVSGDVEKNGSWSVVRTGLLPAVAATEMAGEIFGRSSAENRRRRLGVMRRTFGGRESLTRARLGEMYEAMGCDAAGERGVEISSSGKSESHAFERGLSHGLPRW